ncbi:MAG: hypothetical protein ACI90G_002367, partial [Urechidicola sp.]
MSRVLLKNGSRARVGGFNETQCYAISTPVDQLIGLFL